MRRSIVLVSALWTLLVLASFLPQHSGAETNAVRLVSSAIVPNSSSVKRPQPAGNGDQIHLAASVGGTKQSHFWNKRDSDANFPDAIQLGTIGENGNPNYASSGIAVAGDGSAYVVWADHSSSSARKLLVRRRFPDGTFDTTRTAISSSGFMSYPQIAVRSDGAIFVVWNEPQIPPQYRFSTDGGVTWSSTGSIGNVVLINQAAISAGPNGAVGVAFGGNNGHIYAAFWNGSGFTVEDVTPSLGTNEYFADPTIDFASDGTAYVAWRNVGGGIMYAVRQSNGTWPRSRLMNGTAYGSVSITLDDRDNIHMFWAGDASGNWEAWYAYENSQGQWEGPINVAYDGVFIANGRGSATVSDKVYGHGVVEYHLSSGPVARYFLFSSDDPVATPTPTTPPLPSARPIIENDANFTKKTSLSVSFTDIVNNPSEVRWNWGAPPSDTDNDSNGWQPFANTITVAAPALQDASACGIYTLYTQVRGSQGTQAEASSDSITLDQDIQASALIASLTSPGSPNVSPSGGESYPTAGESDWIRTPNYVYQVSDEPSVCSGLESYTAADTDDSIHSGSDTSAYLVTLDGKLLTAEGDGFAEQEVIATILFTDTLGNTGIATRTLYFDDDSPVITNAATPDLLTADNGGGTEALATLYFTDVLVSDDSYGAFIGQTDKAYWGIWALVTTQDLGDTPSGSDFFAGGAQVIELTPGATSVKMSLVSFTDSDPGSDPGTRYIYVRFLDGAGNFSSEVLRTTVTLAADYQLPTIHLPVTMR